MRATEVIGLESHSLRVALAVVMALLASSPSMSRGATFSPYQCSVCPTTTNITVSVKMSDLPTDQSCSDVDCPHYINNIDYQRVFYANNYVKQFNFYTAGGNLETNYDYLKYGEYGSGVESLLTGSIGYGYRSWSSSTVMQQHPLQIHYTTDSSATRVGTSVTAANVCCNSSAGSSTPADFMDDGVRYSGYLFTTNDVVYLKYYVPAHPDHARTGFALWPDVTSTGADFDLYIRCNSAPTGTTYYTRGYSGDPYEFVSVPNSDCSAGIWYIAVHSFTGSGQFSVTAASEYTDTGYTNRAGYLALRAGILNYNANATELQDISNTLVGSSKYHYGETEGEQLVYHYDLYNNVSSCATGCGGNKCNICYLNQSGWAWSGWNPSNWSLDDSGTGANIALSCWYEPRCLAHEMGHYLNQLPDEYDVNNGNALECGHSIMGDNWEDNYNYCVAHDHGADRAIGEGAPAFSSAWTNISSLVPVAVSLNRTPDNYAFASHDFNNFITVTVH